MADQPGGNGRRGEPLWWEQYALLRAGGASQAEAAAGAGVSERHARRGERGSPGLRRRISEFRAEVLRANAERLQNLVAKTIDRLEDLLGCSEVPPVQLGACKEILKNALLFRQQVTVEERLAALEEKVLGGRADGEQVGGE